MLNLLVPFSASTLDPLLSSPLYLETDYANYAADMQEQETWERDDQGLDNNENHASDKVNRNRKRHREDQDVGGEQVQEGQVGIESNKKSRPSMVQAEGDGQDEEDMDDFEQVI